MSEAQRSKYIISNKCTRLKYFIDGRVCNNRCQRAGYQAAILRYSTNHVTLFVSRDVKPPQSVVIILKCKPGRAI